MSTGVLSLGFSGQGFEFHQRGLTAGSVFAFPSIERIARNAEASARVGHVPALGSFCKDAQFPFDVALSLGAELVFCHPSGLLT